MINSIIKYFIILLGIVIPFNIIPNIKILYYGVESVITFGITEFVYLCTYIIVGFSIYYIYQIVYSIFGKGYGILIMLLYLLLIDIHFFYYAPLKISMVLGFVRCTQLLLFFLLYGKGLLKFNIIISILYIMFLLLIGDFIGFRFFELINFLG